MEQPFFESLARLAMACDRPAPQEAAAEDAHRAAFERWLGLSPDERTDDLRAYLASHRWERLLALWVREPYYRDLAPAGATREQQRRFDASMQRAMALLRGS